MGIVQEVIRYIFIRAKTDGVDQATTSLKKLGVAEAEVTKASLSTENALNRLRMSIDAEFRSQSGLTKATETLARARSQGLISIAEEARLLELAGNRYGGMAHGAGAATSQVMALTHVARSMTEQIAMGVPVTQALTAQFSHLSYIASAPGGLMGAFRGLGALLAPMAAPLLGIAAAVAAIGVGFAGLTTKINETAKTHVSFGNVVVATFQVAAGAIGRFFKPAIDQLGNWWKQFVDWVAPLVKNSVNGIIGTFVGAFNTIKDTWALLPDAFASIFTKAMNGAIDIVQNGINGIIDPINSLLSAVNMPTLGKADLSGFKGTPSNADSDLAGIAGRDFGAAYGTDYAGQAFNAIATQAQALALANAQADASSNKLAKTLHGPLTDGIDKLAAKTNAWVEAAKGAFSDLGTTIIDAFKKGGNVVNNILDALGQKLGQFGESLANSGFNALLNMGLNALTSAFMPTGGSGGNGLWGSAIFAGVHHDGGMAGAATMGRSVPAAAFIGAPRYHNGGMAGLRPDEVPAILQRGERVIPRGGMAGGTIFNITVNGANMTPAEVMAEVNRQIVSTLRRHERHPGRVNFA